MVNSLGRGKGLHTAQLLCNFTLPTVIYARYAYMTVDNPCVFSHVLFALSSIAHISICPLSICGLFSPLPFFYSTSLSALLLTLICLLMPLYLVSLFLLFIIHFFTVITLFNLLPMLLRLCMTIFNSLFRLVIVFKLLV